MTDNYHSLQLTYGCIFFIGTLCEFCSNFTGAIFALRNSLLFAGVGRSHFSSPDAPNPGQFLLKVLIQKLFRSSGDEVESVSEFLGLNCRTAAYLGLGFSAPIFLGEFD